MKSQKLIFCILHHSHYRRFTIIINNSSKVCCFFVCAFVIQLNILSRMFNLAEISQIGSPDWSVDKVWQPLAHRNYNNNNNTRIIIIKGSQTNVPLDPTWKIASRDSGFLLRLYESCQTRSRGSFPSLIPEVRRNLKRMKLFWYAPKYGISTVCTIQIYSVWWYFCFDAHQDFEANVQWERTSDAREAITWQPYIVDWEGRGVSDETDRLGIFFFRFNPLTTNAIKLQTIINIIINNPLLAFSIRLEFYM